MTKIIIVILIKDTWLLPLYHIILNEIKDLTLGFTDYGYFIATEKMMLAKLIVGRKWPEEETQCKKGRYNLTLLSIVAQISQTFNSFRFAAFFGERQG